MKATKKNDADRRDGAKKILIRNIALGILALAAVAAIVLGILLNNGGASYTDVEHSGIQASGSASEENSKNGDSANEKPSVGDTPLVPIEPTP